MKAHDLITSFIVAMVPMAFAYAEDPLPKANIDGNGPGWYPSRSQPSAPAPVWRAIRPGASARRSVRRRSPAEVSATGRRLGRNESIPE